MSPVHQVLGTPELLDIVLRCLRDQIHQDAKAGISTDLASTDPPVKWKVAFMSLVLVNRAFFHASVGILWERMHSLDPFLSLLEASTEATEPALTHDTPCNRFDFYSSKTKSLNLTSVTASHLAQYYWDYRVGVCRPIFPTLVELYLKSMDHIPMSIALSVCQRLKHLEVDLHPRPEASESLDCIVALSDVLAGCQGPLSLLRIRHPAGPRYLQNLSRLKPIKQLLTTVTFEDVSAIGPTFWQHRQVAFEESLDDGVEEDYQKACIVNVRELSRLHRYQHRFIIVHAGSRLQALLAENYAKSSPSRSSFNQITLELPSNGTPTEDPLNPGTIGTYLVHNPNLMVLTVNCMTDAFMSQEAGIVERARANPAFGDVRAFLDPLSAAENLTFFSVCGIVFKPRDIVLQMLAVLRKLPRLTDFTFFPAQLSKQAEDIVLLPPFTTLAEIQENNPRLIRLGMYLDLSVEVEGLPSLSPTFTSSHPLEQTTLFPGLTLDPENFPTYSTREILKVAMFLNRLFPNLRTGRKPFGAGAVGAFWDSVYESISSFQEVRALEVRGFHRMLDERGL